MTSRRLVLVLGLQAQNLRSPIVAWSQYGPDEDDCTMPGCDDQPPYLTPLEALRDGWRLVQYSRQPDPAPGAELRPGFLACECVLEKEEIHA